MEKSIKNLLNKWVKDDNMIVTFNMLSRELNVQPNEGKNLLLDYCNEPENCNLNPVVLLSGKTGPNNKFMELVNDLSVLDERKSQFLSVESLYIYAVSLSKVKDLTMIVNFENNYNLSNPNKLSQQSKPSASSSPTNKPIKTVKSDSNNQQSSNKSQQIDRQTKDNANQKPVKSSTKKRIVESDDDDDDINNGLSSTPLTPSEETDKSKQPFEYDNKSKKRKITKSVMRTNEKGYMVSEDIDEWVNENGKPTSPPPQQQQSSTEEKSITNTKPNSDNTQKPKPKPTNSKTKPASKAKGQSSLNSFFKKKT